MSQILFACGLAGLVLSIVGLLSLWKNYMPGIKLYIIILGIMVIIQLAIASRILDVNINDTLRLTFMDTSRGTANIAERDAYMNYLNCCGWYKSYDMIADYPLCVGSPGAEGYSLGCPGWPSLASCWPPCETKTKAFLAKNIRPLATFAVIVSVFEVGALVVSCCLIMGAKRDKDDFGGDPFGY